jgi:hypothetical protein
MPFSTTMFSRQLPIAVATDITFNYFCYTYDLKTWIRNNVVGAPAGIGPIAFDSGTNAFIMRNQSNNNTSNCYIMFGGSLFGTTAAQTNISSANSKLYSQFAKGTHLSGAFHIHQGNGQVMRYVNSAWASVRAYTAAAVDIRTLTYDSVTNAYAGSVGGLGIYTTNFSASPWTLPGLGFGTSPNAYGLAKGSDRRLVLGGIGGGVGKISTSDDSGQSWTNRTIPVGTTRIVSLVYSTDLGIYAYLSLTGQIGTSTDGTTWSERYTSSNLSTPAFIGYSPSLKKMFAVDNALSNYELSADGITWAGGAITKANYSAFGGLSTWGQVTVVR